MTETSEYARSEQGEQFAQTETTPARRARFVGMSINDLGQQLTKRQRVTCTVQGVVKGVHDDDDAKLMPIETAVITVTDVTVDSVEDPPKDDPDLFTVRDDVDET